MKFAQTMKRQLPYFFSLLIWLVSLTSSLGQVQVDSTGVVDPEIEIQKEETPIQPLPETFTYVREAPGDTTLLAEKSKESKKQKDNIHYPLVSALAMYFDYPKLFSFFTEYEIKAEVGLQMQLFKHIILSTELGRGRIQPTNFYKNANYEVSGSYVRLGVVYTKPLGAKSRLNFGFNYGSSFFNDKGNIEIESPSGLFNSFEEPFKRTGLNGDWFEVTFGTESHLGKNLYLGFLGRLRILNDYDSFEDLDVFAIPGYGRTFDKSIPALNMYIKYRIQFY